MRVIKKGALLLVLFLIFILFIMNYRYPFVTYGSDGWSVGYTEVDDIFPRVKINSRNILTSIDLNKEHPNIESKFIADPFFIYKKDTTFLFVENLRKGRKEGATIDLYIKTKNNQPIYKGAVLEENFHLSYPQVFKDKGSYYMLPDNKLKELYLYKAIKFPYQWEICDTLIRGIQVKDATILLDKKNTLLITCDKAKRLLVYKSDSLRGKWKELNRYPKLRGNEVRPGGRIFKYKEELYIPMQNYSKGYGTGVSLYKIIIEDSNTIDLIKTNNLFLKEQKNITVFNQGMHHLDIQKIKDKFIVYYDGDRANNKSKFSWDRSRSLNKSDLTNLIYVRMLKKDFDKNE